MDAEKKSGRTGQVRSGLTYFIIFCRAGKGVELLRFLKKTEDQQ